MTRIIANTDQDFVLYSGDDSLTMPVLAIGGAGVVSVASHVIGNQLQEMVKAFLAGENEKAAKLHQHLLPIMQGLFTAPSPAPVKTALQITGLDVGSVRLPLVGLTEQERAAIITVLNTL
jgi:4-hydroxy-tetrahydrodipicolinate synthase